jgi:hypothetical protein
MATSKASTDRRTFLKQAGLALPLLLGVTAASGAEGDPAPAPASAPSPAGTNVPAELAADLVIIGGGVGGCAAALAAARQGLRVILTEETDWIGGQFTSQAVPPDENRWIETCGGTRSYQEFRTTIRNYYRRNYPLTTAARALPHFNPGNCWVSALGHEPRVSLAAFYELLAPYLGNGRVQILLNHRATAADTDHDRVQAVRVVDRESGRETILRAPYFADATELGDLLPLTGTEYALGADAQRDTQEEHALAKAEPLNQQPFTMSFAMEYRAGENHVMDRPREYAFWRDFVPQNQHGAKFPLFTMSDPEAAKIGFDPGARTGFWSYRRIADRDNFTPGFYGGDVTLANWRHNDYTLGTLVDVPADEAARQIERARQQSLSLLYWLQTEAPRPDGGTGWPGLRLRPDLLGTADGLVKHPYVREGRRLRAEFTILEHHVSLTERMKITGRKAAEATAEQFPDTVGIGSYTIDIHATVRHGGFFLKTAPFQIPLGALLPQRLENLLPACKNIGVTHITNGCYRLHPVEWNIGESTGCLAAFCLGQKCAPRQVRNDPARRADFQALLQRAGVPLAWPGDLVRT